MLNKKLVMTAGILLLVLGIVLSGVLPESEFFHVPFQLLVLAVVMLSVHMSIKDILIVVMIAIIVIWGITSFNIIEMKFQLMLETGTLILVLFALGNYETGHKEERQKIHVISNYKKREVDNVRAGIEALNAENHGISEKIKEIRKLF
jgi:cation transport ATPase